MSPRLDTSIFDREHTAEEARRARKIENIYHAGQDKIWDGRQLLSDLAVKHGGIHMPVEKQRALARLFSSLMWGELAAWKISAQLADALPSFEAKMAATSQAHDEARHFYVLHDYLGMLQIELPEITRPTRLLLETVLGTEVLVQKLVGMQLFVESMALTIFRTVRELAVEPVLSELLIFFERDEARHVGLGIQHTPDLVRGMTLAERARLDAYQLRILLLALVSLKTLEPSFLALGIDPRKVSDAGRERMFHTMELLNEAAGERVVQVAGPTVRRIFDATTELMFPPLEGSRGVTSRLFHAAQRFAQA